MERFTMKENGDISKTLGISRDSGGKKRLGKWVLGLLIILVLGGGAFFWMNARKEAQAVQYRTQEVTSGDLTVTVTATGSLAPTGEVEVGSELSGIVSKVFVDYNDRVEMGQTLALIDDTKFAAAVMASKASLASAKAGLEQAEATVRQRRQNLKRLKEAARLSGGKALSPNDLESAEADLARALAEAASARAAILQAEANLKVDETNLSKTVIVSPVDGMVLQREIDPGQTVAASMQAPVLFKLAEDLTRMDLQVDVDEADVGKVREGQEALFSVDAYPERQFKARITQVRYGSETTDGVVTYKTLLKVENDDLALRPGMTATADIIVEKRQGALLVPNTALRFTPPQENTETKSRGLVGMLLPRPPHRVNASNAARGKTPRVHVLKNGVPEPVTVTTGPTDGARTVVTGGDLKEGMAVVVDTVTVAS